MWYHKALFNISQKLRLILLHRNKIVTAGIDDGFADVAMTIGRITNDQLSFQHQTADQSQSRFLFVRLGRNLHTPDDRAQDGLHSNENLFCSSFAVPSTSQRFSIPDFRVY